MKKIRILLTMLLLVGGGLFQLSAQNITINGVVTDASTGEGIPMAAVQVKGTTTGAAADAFGAYSISAPKNAVLVISSIGYSSVEVSINGRAKIDVSLAPDTETLEETMVVAFGTTTKKDFTGSVSSVDSKKLEKRSLSNALNAIEGVATGVQFTTASGQPGSSGGIYVRGIGSINASNSPLYVVDGVPYGDGLANINSDDVESISVLKDAASSSLYGSRAANGVVIITTKKGRSDKLNVSAKISHGISQRGIKEYDRIDAYDYYPMQWESMKNSLISASGLTAEAAGQKAAEQIYDALMNNPFNVPNDQIVDANGKLNPSAKLLYPDDLDWAKAIERLGHKQDYTFSASGASKKADYYFSAGWLDEQGYTIKSYFKRATARANMNVQPVKWFKTGVNMSGTFSRSNTTNTDSGTGYVNPFYFTRNIGPIYPIYKHNEDGSFYLDENGEKVYEWDNRGAGASNGRHVIAETLWNDNLNLRTALNTRIYADFNLYEGLKFSINYGLDLRHQNNSSSENPEVGDGSPAGRSNVDIYFYNTQNFNQMLTYNKTFRGHSIDAMVGHESYHRYYNYVYGRKQGLIAEGNTNLVNYTTINSLSGYENNLKTEGYLSRVNYNYNHKYYVSASYRRDASSRFYRDNRWGNFWSVSGSWRLDQEDFLKGSKVDLLKLRASYGSVGNDGTDGWYPWMSLYSIYRYGNAAGFIQSTLAGNKEISWEVNKNFDLAVDFGFFNNRLSGSLEYFHRISDNLLFEVDLPYSSGVTSQWQNIGTMYNQGLELQINADIIRTRDVTWSTTLNASTYQNRITKLPGNYPPDGFVSGNKKLMVGHSIYDYYMYEFAGVDPETGDSTFWKDSYKLDDNGDYLYDDLGNKIVESSEITHDYTEATKRYVGTSIPDVFGTLNNTLRYKNFELSVLFNYQIGGKTYNSSYASLMSFGSYGSSMHVDILKRWQNPGDITDVPRVDNAKSAYQNPTSSRFLVSSSYLGLKSASLSYTLPKKVVEKIQLSGMSVYLTGENLFNICAMKGMNPQYSLGGSQYNGYGYARIMTLGLNLNF